jgi:hypothetical protein
VQIRRPRRPLAGQTKHAVVAPIDAMNACRGKLECLIACMDRCVVRTASGSLRACAHARVDKNTRCHLSPGRETHPARRRNGCHILQHAAHVMRHAIIQSYSRFEFAPLTRPQRNVNCVVGIYYLVLFRTAIVFKLNYRILLKKKKRSRLDYYVYNPSLNSRKSQQFSCIFEKKSCQQCS